MLASTRHLNIGDWIGHEREVLKGFLVDFLLRDELPPLPLFSTFLAFAMSRFKRERILVLLFENGVHG